MRVLLQRVSSASVSVNRQVLGEIQQGLLLLVGFCSTDTPSVLPGMARKIIGLRIFEDADGKLQYDVNTANGRLLVVPQFTLYADTKRGRRPDFTQALNPEIASRLFDLFVQELASVSDQLPQQGRFGANMQVALINDGPLTILLEK